MGQVTTVTIAAVSYNVYSLTADAVLDADNYFAAHLDAAVWTAATSDRKKQALVTAQRAIDREEWSGEPSVPSQPTDWPRTGATRNGEPVAAGTPDDIALGEFEYALALMKSPALLGKSDTASNIKAVAAGSAHVEYFYPLPGQTTRWPLPVNDLLAPYLAGAASALDTLIPGVGSGGTDAAASAFTDLDMDRSQGFA